MCDGLISFSLNTTFVGKPTKTQLDDGSTALIHQGPQGPKIVNLGYGYQTIQASYTDIFALLTEDGYSIAPALTAENRCVKTFASIQLLLVDIDSGMRIEELQQHEFYRKYGSGYYCTPSHTENEHRFRIIYRLEHPVYEIDIVKSLYIGLMLLHGAADPACKDPARLFFGTVQAQHKEITQRYVDDEGLVEILLAAAEYEEQQQAELLKAAAAAEQYKDRVMLPEERQLVLDLLRGRFVGDYCVWRNIGWGLKSQGFSLEDFQYVTTGMMNQKTPKDAAKVWSDGSAGGDVTMGTVWHHLFAHYGKEAVLEKMQGFRQKERKQDRELLQAVLAKKYGKKTQREKQQEIINKYK